MMGDKQTLAEAIEEFKRDVWEAWEPVIMWLLDRPRVMAAFILAYMAFFAMVVYLEHVL